MRSVMFGGFVAVLAVAGPLTAGPLDPPAGPVAPTHKTLTEMEPRIAVNAANTPGDADSLFKISQPGSYHLTGNIIGQVGKHGIEIAASGVTLDLNGFDLVGVPAMGLFDGVSTTVSDLVGISIRNGSIRNWGDEGVDLGTFPAPNCAVADIRASGNAGRGIFVGSGCTVTGCSAYVNASFGIATGAGSTITGCTAYNNGSAGIGTGAGATIVGCSAFSNTGLGISAGDTAAITHCSARSNASHGISASFGSSITNCAARLNQGHGFVVSSGSTITDCSAQENNLDGINVAGESTIRGNRCDSNGPGVNSGAGIHAIFGDNVIEGNTCTRNDRGIDVDVAGNVIIRNACSGNTTNWTIVANNVVGPILDRTAPASAAITGNSAPDSTGSTHPNANFTY